MRSSWLAVAAVLAAAGCRSSTAVAPGPTTPADGATAPGTSLGNSTRSCRDAALGLEGATRGVRGPEQPIFEALRLRCAEDAWPTIAIDCFATMQEGDLGRCSRSLPEQPREAMFSVLGGGGADRAGLLVARARLEQLNVGVAACDQFVTAVSSVLTCDGMPIDTRVQLGRETAQFWSLPTHRLGDDDLQRMSAICGESLATLQQQAASVGCMP